MNRTLWDITSGVVIAVSLVVLAIYDVSIK